MSQHYRQPGRANDPWALQDVEVFYMQPRDFLTNIDGTWMAEAMSERAADQTSEAAARDLTGWYYWYCFPGCLPDSDPNGPYATEQAAINAAQKED